MNVTSDIFEAIDAGDAARVRTLVAEDPASAARRCSVTLARGQDGHRGYLVRSVDGATKHAAVPSA